MLCLSGFVPGGIKHVALLLDDWCGSIRSLLSRFRAKLGLSLHGLSLVLEQYSFQLQLCSFFLTVATNRAVQGFEISAARFMRSVSRQVKHADGGS